VITLDEAATFVLAGCAPLPPKRMALDDALGCVLAGNVVSGEAVPPFANTAMDGYGVRAADTAAAPVRLEVVGTLAAGAAPDIEVGPGQAVRIMTGAPIPPGVDAVVMVERTEALDGGAAVEVQVAVEPGNHVRPAGDDLQPGQTVFVAGEVVTPGHLGVLASIGQLEVVAVPRARVGVLSTGDELVEGGGPLRPGQIRDSNRRTLLALLEQAGCDGVDLGLVRDDEDAITAAVEAGLAGCDALITSGGVSVGDFDFVKAVLDRLGEMRWMQIAIKPAKPLAFGVVAGKPVFGLPGNPVSSMVSFELFARPALRKMMGHTAINRPFVEAIADDDLLRGYDGKIHFVRVVARYEALEGAFHVRSAGKQGSHQLSAMAGANALAMLPPGGGAASGEGVAVLLLGDWS
jgi:molybdenum cofactor synthesis domain-containing protein